MSRLLTILPKYQISKHTKRYLKNILVCHGSTRKIESAAALSSDSHLFEFHGNWPDEKRKIFLEDMRIVPNFINDKEEENLIAEIEPYMKRLHYEFDHWDDAIHGFRETERKNWYPYNRAIMERVRQVAFDKEIMPYVHILDLAEDGVIKPHVDSTRYCGNIIAGISLLSDCVMRLVHTQKDVENSSTSVEEVESPYRNQPKIQLENNLYVNLWIQRKSLYIMSNYARYDFTHEILSNEFSKFCGQHIKKHRRISIICRNNP